MATALRAARQRLAEQLVLSVEGRARAGSVSRSRTLFSVGAPGTSLTRARPSVRGPVYSRQSVSSHAYAGQSVSGHANAGQSVSGHANGKQSVRSPAPSRLQMNSLSPNVGACERQGGTDRPSMQAGSRLSFFQAWPTQWASAGGWVAAWSDM